jgi:hypothetical protein
MRRWAIRLAVLSAGVGVSAATAPTLSAWVDTTSNPSGTLSAIPDWVPPAIDRLVVQKSEGGVSGYAKPGGTYHICAKIGPDSGNPASGLKDVVSSTLANGPITAVLGSLGGTTVCAPTDNRDSGALAVAANATVGSRTISMTVRDNSNNTRTQTTPVILDNTPPVVTSFTATNRNGPAGVGAGMPESGDIITLTYSEPIDPHAVIPGWDGSGTQPLYVGFINDNKDDRIQFRRAGSVLTPLTATFGATPWIDLQQNYVNGNTTFTSTIEVSGNSFVIRMGSPSVTGVFRTDLGTVGARWSTSSSLFDRAGNGLAGTTVTQAAGLKF